MAAGRVGRYCARPGPSVAVAHVARRRHRGGDALVGCTDAWGRIANDVATLSRPEIGELCRGHWRRLVDDAAEGQPGALGAGPAGALTGPPLAATLHLAAATSVDERPDGAWHAEWATLRDLARRTVVAASQTSELITGLLVDQDRMAATWPQQLESRQSSNRWPTWQVASRAKTIWAPPSSIIDRVLARADQRLGAV